MPIEILFRTPEKETRLGTLDTGQAGTFRDFSVDPAIIISGICGKGEGVIYHLPNQGTPGSKLYGVPKREYTDDRIAKELTPGDDTYEREITTEGGAEGTLVFQLK